jgi:hypothetical protein
MKIYVCIFEFEKNFSGARFEIFEFLNALLKIVISNDFISFHIFIFEVFYYI